MKTKKSDEFVKHAQKRPRTKFAIVGKGSSWTIYEGTDLAKAAPGKGEEVIKASCQKTPTALNVLVVGGTTEITVLKTKVFAPQLKENAKALTFKAINNEENGELEKLQMELDGPLVETVGKLPNPPRDTLVALLNQAKALAADGDLGGAKGKVQELKRGMGSQGGSSEQDERQALLGQLQGQLVGQVAQLKNPQRDPLIAALNEAIKLAKGGDLQLAKEKVAKLKEELAKIPPPRPKSEAPELTPNATFKNRLLALTPVFQKVVSSGPKNKDRLEAALKEANEAARNGKYDVALSLLDRVEAQLGLAVGEALLALKAEKDLNKKIQLCEAFLKDYARYGTECAAVEDIYAEARKTWGVEEAKKAYGQQMKGEDTPYNPGNKFDPKFRRDDEKDVILNPVEVKRLAKKYGLDESEVIAIRTYTASDYKYINPGVANQKDHPERQKPGKDGKPIDWMTSQNKPDPSKAKNDTEKKQLEKELEAWERENKAKGMSEEGALHAGMLMQAFKKLPKKSGPLYRGARMNMQRFNSEYAVGKEIPIEAFISQSVSPDVARGFADGGGSFPPPQDATVSVFVEVQVQDARDISEMSIYGQTEAEWLLPPGGKFVVDKIEEDSVKHDGAPKATAWKKVKMRQVPGGK